jgi:MYXO-CTERM domain-containing protein
LEMGRRIAAALGLAVIMFACAASAPAALSLQYEGSLKLPRTSITDYYARSVAIVPDGNTRPGWGGAPVVGPSLMVTYDWAGNTFEYNQLPALETTPAGIAAAASAVELPVASGGTQYKAQHVMSVDSAGNLWDMSTLNTSSGGPAMYSEPGVHTLGTSGTTANYKIQESGWPGNYSLNGFLRRGDGSGGDNPTDGTAIGAKFIGARRGSGGEETNVNIHVYEVERVDATTMTSTEQFMFYTGLPWGKDAEVELHAWQFAYVRAGAKEYYLGWLRGGHSGDSFTLRVWDAATATGVDPAYETIDIGPDIAGGAGWLDASGIVRYIGVDWDNSRLYVLEQRLRDARIHVFSAVVPEPATLGLVGLGLLPLLRRRRGRK